MEAIRSGYERERCAVTRAASYVGTLTMSFVLAVSWLSPASWASGDGRVIVLGRKVHDYAELLDLATREGIRPGSVVAWDSDAGRIVPASTSNARRVIGVISGAGGACARGWSSARARTRAATSRCP